jgi:hypothetical protein
MAKKPPDRDDLVQQLLEHAIEHYDKVFGCDYVVESMSDEQIAMAIGDATTFDRAYQNLRTYLKATVPDADVLKMSDAFQARKAARDAEPKEDEAKAPRPKPASPAATGERAALVQAVRDHARTNRGRDHRDRVQHLTNPEVAGAIGTADTRAGAIAAVGRVLHRLALQKK